MATIELGPGGHYADANTGARSLGVRRVLFPAIRWGAVLAGVAVGISAQLALSLLGIATGLSAIDITQGDNISATGPVIWAAISMLLSALIGGYVSARMSGLKRKVDGVLHGAVSWGVTTLLFAMLATSVTGSLLSGVFGSMTPAMSRAAGESATVSMLRNRIGASIDTPTMQRLSSDIQNGRRDEAIQLLTGTVGVEPGRASTIIDQALILSGHAERASPSGRAAAERVVETAGTTAWTVFLAVALSLVLGMLGGALGAIGARRTTWTGSTSSDTAMAP
jgi:hypothetical protein